MALSRTGLLVLCVIVILVGFGIGFLSGFFAEKNGSRQDLLQSLTREADKTISKKLIDEVNPDNIRDYLR